MERKRKEGGIYMISYEFFEEELSKTAQLMGWRITKERTKLIHEKVMNFEKEDVLKALDSALEYENFNFYRFLGSLNYYKGQREDRQQAERHKKERDEFMEWWRSHKGTRNECINEFNCYSCKRAYCDIIALDAITACAEVMSGQTTIENMNKKLSKYKGMGWEKYLPEAQAF